MNLDAFRAARSPFARAPKALARVVTAVVVLTVASATVRAQKTDTITLLNGDHFTGEVKRLSRGRLEVFTDDAGTIAIEWDKVARVQLLPSQLSGASREETRKDTSAS